MRALFRSVAEAACEVGLRDLLEDVPGGKFVCKLAEKTYEKYQKRVDAAKQQQQVEEIARAKFEEARDAAVEVVREVVKQLPPALAPTDADIILLEHYLTAIPEATRQSLRSAADPAGHTAPAGFRLQSADDVVKLLPPRGPRFTPGDALPGKAGWVLERLLGLGGFGEVWLARHATMRSLNGAAKFYFDRHGRDLIREAELIDRVMHAGSHPNIVRLKDVHLDSPTPWLLFEYVDGGNLSSQCHHLAALPADERLPKVQAILGQLCDAMAFVTA